MAKTAVNHFGQTVDLDTGAILGGSAPQAAGGLDPQMLALIQTMRGGGQQQIDLGPLLDKLHPPDVQGIANRGYMPGVDNAFNPFSNGFFKSGAERAQVEKDRLTVNPEHPVYGMTGVQAGLGPATLPPPGAAPTQSPFSAMMPSAMPNLASRAPTKPFVPFPRPTAPYGTDERYQQALTLSKLFAQGQGR